jgi:hypothetical protein
MTTPTTANERPPAAQRSLVQPRTLLLLLLFVALIVVGMRRAHLHFDWRSLGMQLRAVSPLEVILAVAIIYVCYIFRAWRWAVLIRPQRTTTVRAMIGPQLIGFALVGLIGRVADLARPYLIARRLQTTVATQLAVYSIERAFDLGAAAILFSITLAFAPRNMPHHEAFARAGILSLAATVFLVVFAVALRMAGGRIATLVERLLRPLSAKLAASIAGHVLSFSEGLRIVSSMGEFLAALSLSLVMWLGIALAYIECAHAFHTSPALAGLTFAGTMLMMATSMGGSVLQLPVVGWFTQIALLAAALHAFFGAPLEVATACGAVMLIVMNLVVIPGGLIAARLEGISLMDAARAPEAVEP